MDEYIVLARMMEKIGAKIGNRVLIAFCSL